LLLAGANGCIEIDDIWPQFRDTRHVIEEDKRQLPLIAWLEHTGDDPSVEGSLCFSQTKGRPCLKQLDTWALVAKHTVAYMAR
jgi:hypothetical protein